MRSALRHERVEASAKAAPAGILRPAALASGAERSATDPSIGPPMGDKPAHSSAPFRAPAARRGGVSPGFALAAPALTAIAVFFFLPAAAAFLLSLTDFDLYAIASAANLRFVGASNYTRLVEEPAFWRALGNTAWFAILAGPLTVFTALGAALALDARTLIGRSLFRTAFLIPVVTTLVAVAVVWRYLYHPRSGLLNYGLAALGIGPIDWLGDPAWAMPAIALLAVWKGFGFNMLVFLAALQAIPERLYEAARIDGAGRWHQLRWVTLPMLRPTFVFVGVMTAIGCLQLFAEPYVMTGGGPAGSTESLVLLMYRQGFRWWNLGQATAIAFVLFAIMLVVTALTVGLRSRVDEGEESGAEPAWRAEATR
jgi:multiple sugar transport system permease protein